MRSSWDVVDRRAINYLWDLVVEKLLEFASGRRELSELEEKDVKYWKEWLRKYQSSEGPYYHAKGHAWKHINDAAQVDRGLALLVIIVSKATHLMKLCPGYCCSLEFQHWWYVMVASGGFQQLAALRTIFEERGLDENLHLNS
ncbi:hypothetical protein BFJ63_vAg18004 [Fusarium oxysporum f. sp. narcissi]|uniref:Thymidylate synthase/dCMP hydroxymethylase domain-containing protein n=2 Tax=Fusarium oxysporum TaxID=5507 RepID=A0A4Q2UZE1_FUSOX|nr:hypothetical protein BFJ63_vAg18004 [Fusarium oxysporum f. sp. narcissi]